MTQRSFIHFGRERGQALIEFLVAALAIVPLFLLVPMIAKYQDVSHSTLMASRYVAFEATNRHPGVNSWKPESQLAQEVRRRFFSNSDAPVKTADVAGNFDAHRNLMWSDGFGNPLLRDIERDVQVTFGVSRNASHNGAFSTASDGRPFGNSESFGLSRGGIYTANVSVSLANLPGGVRFIQPFDDISIVITRSSSLVMDGWASPSPQVTQNRLSNTAINPGRALAGFSTVLDPIVMALDGRAVSLSNIRAPRLGQLDYWRDVVPSDRLR
jgi:hypothetical protein